MRAPLALGLLLALAACDDSAVEPPPPPLLPLEVGQTWVFEHTRIRASGPDAGTVTDGGLDTLRVAADTLIEGETWYRLEAYSSFGRGCLGGYYTTRDGDVWHWYYPSDPEGAYLQYRYAVDAGASYPYEVPDATATATVRDTDVQQTVPGGTFTAYWYSIDYDVLEGRPVSDAMPPMERFLAPGVGFVRFESPLFTLGEGDEFILHSTLRWDLVEVIAP
jgi:hypothetical protein